MEEGLVILPTIVRRTLGYLTARRIAERRVQRIFRDGAPSLQRIGEVWGGTAVDVADPPIGVWRDAIYVPRGRGGAHLDTAWGLYAADGHSVTQASYRRGPDPVRVGQSAQTALRPHTVARAPDQPYIYGGTLHRHYGHFLLSGLAWLWPRLQARPVGARIVYHGDDDPEALFRYPFIAACLDALGIGRDDLVRFPEPTALPEIIVPGPSYEESYRAHAVHGRLSAAIGQRLLGTQPPDLDPRPVFLARDRLSMGVRRFVDEPAIIDRLEREGIRIARPETLSLAEQVRVFDRHKLIIGGLGSALHTSLLSPAPRRLLAIHHEPFVPSDFVLVDRLKETRSDYVRPAGTTTGVDLAMTKFQVEFRIDDLDATLDALLRLIDLRMRQV